MVVLYIFEHEKTGLKYFGKTTKYLSEKELEKYDGSGSYWRKHIKKHGNFIKKTIYGIYSTDKDSDNYVKPVALKFSEDNDIVNSDNWANLIPENGLDGGGRLKGFTVSEETKEKMRIANKNSTYKHSPETIEKMKIANKDRVLSTETREKISKSKQGQGKGIKKSEEHKSKIAESVKNKMKSKEVQKKLRKPKKPQKKIKCPYCEMIGASGNMKKYHFEKCKKYIIQP